MSAATKPSTDTFVTREELAVELKISLHTLDAWRTSGRLPEPALEERDGKNRVRHVRWTRAQIDAWVAGGCRGRGSKVKR